MSRRYTATLATASKPTPETLRTSFIFLKTWVVCSLTPPATNSTVAGLSAICPEQNTRLSAITAWEYGPIALGALSVCTDFIISTHITTEDESLQFSSFHAL